MSEFRWAKYDPGEYGRMRARAVGQALSGLYPRETALVVLTLPANDNEVPFGPDRVGERARKVIDEFLTAARE